MEARIERRLDAAQGADHRRGADVLQIVEAGQQDLADGHEPALGRIRAVAEHDPAAADETAPAERPAAAEAEDLGRGEGLQAPDPGVVPVEDGPVARPLAEDELGLGQRNRRRTRGASRGGSGRR